MYQQTNHNLLTHEIEVFLQDYFALKNTAIHDAIEPLNTAVKTVYQLQSIELDPSQDSIIIHYSKFGEIYHFLFPVSLQAFVNGTFPSWKFMLKELLDEYE